MKTLGVLRALGPIDARSIARDSLLGWIALLPPLVGLLLRFAAPALDAWSRARFDFPLEPWYPLLTSYFVVLMAPMIVGLVVGFLLLEERDGDTLTALLVTPLPLVAYLRYRIALPTLAAALVTLVAYAAAGLTRVPAAQLVGVALVSACQAPLLALFLAGFAADKVQGFALVKGLGAVLLAPVLSWFVAPPWQYLAGILPTYWPVKAFWLAQAGLPGAWPCLGLGLALNALLLWALLARFRRVVHR
jgi:fluoroquinolone transport system permease protein